MTALKSLMGRKGFVCDITHLWPFPTIESQCLDIKTLFLASLLTRAFFVSRLLNTNISSTLRINFVFFIT